MKRSKPRDGLRAVSPIAAIAAVFTAACCLGVASAVSLATAVGATFLTRDSTLRPMLIASLTLTVAGSALTFWRRRLIWPLVITVLASITIYMSVYGASSHDTMNDNMSDPSLSHALSSGRQAVVWIAALTLIAAQVWDLLRVRTSRNAAAEPDEAPETRRPTGS